MGTGMLIPVPHDLTFPLPSTEGGVGSGADHHTTARFPQITSLCYIRSHLWLGELTERQFHTTPESFFWQPTIGHIAHFKVREEPHATNVGQAEAGKSCSGAYKKARASVLEVNNLWKQAPPGLQETLSSRAFGTLHWGPLSRASSLLFRARGVRMCRSTAKLARWGRGRGERVFRTPAEVDNGRQSVQDDRKGHFLGGLAGGCSPALYSPIKNESP